MLNNGYENRHGTASSRRVYKALRFAGRFVRHRRRASFRHWPPGAVQFIEREGVAFAGNGATRGKSLRRQDGHPAQDADKLRCLSHAPARERNTGQALPERVGIKCTVDKESFAFL